MDNLDETIEDLNINLIFDLGYFVKGTDMYVPVEDYLKVFPEEKETIISKIIFDSYVIMSTHPTSIKDKNKLIALINRNKNIKKLKLK